jgi:hypothetical protein
MLAIAALLTSQDGAYSWAQTRSQRPDVSCAHFSPDPEDRSGPPINFFAVLSADEESAVTESPGVGRVDFVLDRRTLKLSWKVSFRKLTSAALGMHVHGPQTPGGEAGILFELAPAGALRDGFAGFKVLDDGLLGYLVQDRLYVNLHTRRYPAGELRGPVRKVRPDCSRVS